MLETDTQVWLLGKGHTWHSQASSQLGHSHLSIRIMPHSGFNLEMSGKHCLVRKPTDYFMGVFMCTPCVETLHSRHYLCAMSMPNLSMHREHENMGRAQSTTLTNATTSRYPLIDSNNTEYRNLQSNQ